MGRILVPLPWLEQTMYWVVGMSAWVYTIYRVYHSSQELTPELQYLDDGWSVLGGRKIDRGEVKWGLYQTVIIWRVLVCIAWHETFSQVTRMCRVGTTTRKILLLTVGVVCMSWAVSWRLVVFLAIKTVIVYLITLFVNSLLVVWAAVICDIVIFSTHFKRFILVGLPGIQLYADYFMILSIVSFTTFKIIAFASERVWFASRHGDQSTCLSAWEGRSELHPLHTPESQPPRSASISPLTSTDSTAATSSHCSSNSETRKRDNLNRSTSRSDTDRAPEMLHRSAASVGATQGGSHSPSVGATQGGSHSPSVGATQGGSHSPSVEATQGGSHPPSEEATQGGSHSPPPLRCPDLVDGLLYAFYMPFASPGLLVPLQVFLARIENPLPLTSGLLVEVAWLLVRLVFWFFFNDFLLHFLYFSSLKSADVDLLQRLDKWTLSGVLYLLGQFMTCKYAVIYGLPYLLARLDGMWAPTPPACIAYVYRYSDMWRYFDSGMHACLKRYLYRPLKGSKTGQLRHLWAMFICFSFIGFWHGATQEVMAWAVVNCLVEMLQMGAVQLERTSFAKKYLLTRLSPVAMQRVRAVGALPLLHVSLMVQAFFLGNTDFASVVVFRLFLKADFLLLASIVLYCFIHMSNHLQRLGYTKLSNSAPTFRPCPRQGTKNE